MIEPRAEGNATKTSARTHTHTRTHTMSYPSAEDVALSLPHFDDAVKYING